MSDSEYSVPSSITRALRDAGMAPDMSMQARVAEWWGWYTSTAPFYDEDVPMGDGRTMHRHRVTIHPARRVCREWASLLLNDQTTIAADHDAADQ